MRLNPFKYLKLKTALKAGSKVTENAGASNSVPGSTTASRNAQASSTAVDQLSQGLKFTLDNLSSEMVNEFRDFTKARIGELQEGVERYTNSEVDEANAKPWSCSTEEAELIWTACCCSRDVNGKGDYQHTAGLLVREEMKPSMLGTKKGVCIWNDSAKGLLIVAVRGSKAWIDHMVNLSHATDGKPLEAQELEGSHGGYLSCTKALIPGLETTFRRHVQNDEQIRQVLFTGQSSGGAVASLLFFHFASQRSEIFGVAQLSLITFGCPPVTSQNLTTNAERLSRVNLVLSFVNERDFVARACEPYTQSILNLYRHMHGLPVMGDDAALAMQGQDTHDSTAGVLREWRLPSPSSYQIGRIVLLRPSLVHTELTSPACSELEYSHFARLLFCDFDVHKGSQYMARVKALKQRMSHPDQG